jgi:hypothetical protein
MFVAKFFDFIGLSNGMDFTVLHQLFGVLEIQPIGKEIRKYLLLIGTHLSTFKNLSKFKIFKFFNL